MRHSPPRREALANLVAAPALLALARQAGCGAPIRSHDPGPLAEELRACHDQAGKEEAETELSRRSLHALDRAGV